MMFHVQLVTALCAGVGFIGVYIFFPTKGQKTTAGADEIDSAGSRSPEEDGPDPDFTYEEPPEHQSTDRAYRPRWCDILLLEPDASPVAIRKAYARLMKGLHPDVAGGNEHTNRQCALVQEAYRQAMRDRKIIA